MGMQLDPVDRAVHPTMSHVVLALLYYTRVPLKYPVEVVFRVTFAYGSALARTSVWLCCACNLIQGDLLGKS